MMQQSQICLSTRHIDDTAEVCAEALWAADYDGATRRNREHLQRELAVDQAAGTRTTRSDAQCEAVDHKKIRSHGKRREWAEDVDTALVRSELGYELLSQECELTCYFEGREASLRRFDMQRDATLHESPRTKRYQKARSDDAAVDACRRLDRIDEAISWWDLEQRRQTSARVIGWQEPRDAFTRRRWRSSVFLRRRHWADSRAVAANTSSGWWVGCDGSKYHKEDEQWEQHHEPVHEHALAWPLPCPEPLACQQLADEEYMSARGSEDTKSRTGGDVRPAHRDPGQGLR